MNQPRIPRVPEHLAAEAHGQQTASEPVLTLDHVSVSYGTQAALRNVSLTIKRGEILAIVGPSGCGKSTLLSTMNRLTDLIPTCRVTGSIRLGEQEVLSSACNLLGLRRRVGMVFQRANPFPLSIRRNLSLPLREHGIARQHIGPISERVLRQVGLWQEVEQRLDSSALKLSGGQQQRLCLARALALNPEVMLMDEPCSALDPQATEVIESLITQLRSEVTIVLVTHNLAQAARVSTRLAMFWTDGQGGRLIETGPTEQMFSAPQQGTTADYLAGRRG